MAWLPTWLRPKWPGGAMRYRWQPALLALLLFLVAALVGCAVDSTDTASEATTGRSIATNEFSSISAGSGFACGVRTDESVVCWGDDYWGKATPPTMNIPSSAPGIVTRAG